MAKNQPVPSDAFVFFGMSGDLAHKKIFPALYNMVKRDALHVPVIGVASSDWTVKDLRDRARELAEMFPLWAFPPALPFNAPA